MAASEKITTAVALLKGTRRKETLAAGKEGENIS